jgi:hypothetical protein
MSASGTFETCRCGLTISVPRGRPEMVRKPRVPVAFDPTTMSSLIVCESADVRPHRYVATSHPAAGSRMPFSRQSGNEETRSERQLPDRPTYNI